MNFRRWTPVLALLAASLLPLTSVAQSSSMCPAPSGFRSPSVSGERRVLVTGPTVEQVLHLGRDQRSNDIEIVLSISDGPLPAGDLEIRPGTFRKTKSKIPTSALSVTEVRRTEDKLVLSLCIDPKLAKELSPGDYFGSIQINDQRLRGPDIPVKVTRQTPWINLLGWLGIPVSSALGMLGVWLIERRAAGKPSIGKGARTAFLRWVKINGVMALVSGGAASYFIWFAQANSDPSFGAKGTDFIALIGTMVGAAYGTGGIVSAAKGQK